MGVLNEMKDETGDLDSLGPLTAVEGLTAYLQVQLLQECCSICQLAETSLSGRCRNEAALDRKRGTIASHRQ
jgi:hypothetical protein